MASQAHSVAPPRPFDVERIRRDFPTLHQEVNGHPLVYLDNAATAQTPAPVLEAMRRFYERDCANIHRGVHTLSGRATAQYEAARARVARFIGARDPREVIFVRGTTEAINLVAASWGHANVRAGDEIILSELEHHSNIVPWQRLCDETGAVLKVIPVDDEGHLDLAAYGRLLGARTRLVAVTHVSNALGTINPVQRIVEMAHAVGAKVLLDGAQAVPHLPVDVAALGCDFYAFSGHKLYGPMGVGVLYGRYELLEAMPPWQSGGGMIRLVTFERTTYADPPERFEAGTPDVAGVIGLAAAIDYLSDLDLEAAEAHEQALLRRTQAALEQIPGLRLFGRVGPKAAVCSMALEPIHPHDLGTILDQEGVAVRAGHHCTQPLMRRLGVAATLRASFGIYNTESDVEALVRALHRARQVFGLS